MLDLKTLQNDLAFLDLIERQTAVSGRLEQLIAKRELLKVKMYQEMSHPRPHLHIDYGSENHIASYAIDTGERLNGLLNRKYDKVISQWITTNRDKLVSIWEDLQNGGSGKKYSQQLSAL